MSALGTGSVNCVSGTEPAASGAEFDGVGASGHAAGWIEELKIEFVTEWYKFLFI